LNEYYSNGKTRKTGVVDEEEDGKHRRKENSLQ
jgi:hypothetical protein